MIARDEAEERLRAADERQHDLHNQYLDAVAVVPSVRAAHKAMVRAAPGASRDAAMIVLRAARASEPVVDMLWRSWRDAEAERSDWAQLLADLDTLAADPVESGLPPAVGTHYPVPERQARMRTSSERPAPRLDVLVVSDAFGSGLARRLL